MRVAILGPPGTFSHEAACLHFKADLPIFCNDFDEVLEAVIHTDCDCALTPFENSNSLGVVKAQLALASFRSQVFVTDLLTHNIRLNVFCWGEDLRKVTEVRSIDVVFRQAEHWLRENMPDAAQKAWSSTAAAVRSLTEIGSTTLAAIGGRQAAKIPVRAENIQTEPNVTIFCRVERNQPDWEKSDHALIGLSDFTESRSDNLIQFSADFNCGVASNWVVEDYVQKVGIFEIRSFSGNFNLRELCSVVERRIPSAFLMGGYANKSITQLAHDKFCKR